MLDRLGDDAVAHVGFHLEYGDRNAMRSACRACRAAHWMCGSHEITLAAEGDAGELDARVAAAAAVKPMIHDLCVTVNRPDLQLALARMSPLASERGWAPADLGVFWVCGIAHLLLLDDDGGLEFLEGVARTSRLEINVALDVAVAEADVSSRMKALLRSGVHLDTRICGVHHPVPHAELVPAFVVASTWDLRFGISSMIYDCSAWSRFLALPWHLGRMIISGATACSFSGRVASGIGTLFRREGATPRSLYLGRDAATDPGQLPFVRRVLAQSGARLTVDATGAGAASGQAASELFARLAARATCQNIVTFKADGRPDATFAGDAWPPAPEDAARLRDLLAADPILQDAWSVFEF